jgi:hypothetical protein
VSRTIVGDRAEPERSRTLEGGVVSPGVVIFFPPQEALNRANAATRMFFARIVFLRFVVKNFSGYGPDSERASGGLDSDEAGKGCGDLQGELPGLSGLPLIRRILCIASTWPDHRK